MTRRRTAHGQTAGAQGTRSCTVDVDIRLEALVDGMAIPRAPMGNLQSTGPSSPLPWFSEAEHWYRKADCGLKA